MSLEIDEVGPADFASAIEANHVDFGVGTLEGSGSGLREEVLIRETLAAAALPSACSPAASSMTWKQLSALPW